MISSEELGRTLAAASVPVVGSAVRDAGSEGAYYVFVEVQRDSRGRQEPSNSHLMDVRAALAIQGTVVDFILLDGAAKDAEAGLRATLLHSHGAILRNSFLVIDGKSAVVWVVPKKQLSDEELRDLSDRAEFFLQGVGIALKYLTPTTGENLPSKTKCLGVLRLIAPATRTKLAEALRERDFVVPSEDWMSRRLDALRKAGMVVRLYSGRYVLSLAALRALGTVKGAASPDVSRLLALARSRE